MPQMHMVDSRESSQPACDDIALMARVRKGDEGAFAQLVARHEMPLVNFFRRLGAYQVAEDLAQDTFLRLFRYRTRYRPSAKFTTFLYTLARHAWVDHLRQIARRERIVERGRIEWPTSDDATSGVARARLDAQAALATLSEKLRVVVVMSLYQGLGYAEIAKALGIPVGTVKSRMFLALRQLRSWFDEQP